MTNDPDERIFQWKPDGEKLWVTLSVTTSYPPTKVLICMDNEIVEGKGICMMLVPSDTRELAAHLISLADKLEEKV